MRIDQPRKQHCFAQIGDRRIAMFARDLFGASDRENLSIRKRDRAIADDRSVHRRNPPRLKNLNLRAQG